HSLGHPRVLYEPYANYLDYHQVLYAHLCVGEPELYEEYAERAWDLYYGREGNDGQQAASPVHLRAGLGGVAYEAVRKLTHSELMTKDAQGKPMEKGMKLLLTTLKENIGPEKPVKVNELFFVAFYSPSVWRMQSESMQQYIVRREQDFKRLEDALTGATVPTNLRAMMLLAFGGLDAREQLNVLSSVGNEYDLQKISHALRIQFPACSGKPVHRRDYLGCTRASPTPTSPTRTRQKGGKGKGKQRGYALATYEDAEDENEEDAFLDEEDQELYDEALAEGDYEEDPAETLAQEYDLEDPELAEAFAVLAKKKGNQSTATSRDGSQQTFGFKAKGEMTVDQKARETRKNAVRFLKTVTPCTSCGQRGHWSGDPECQNRNKPGKGQGLKKKPVPKKRGGHTAMYVEAPAEHADETPEEHEAFLTFGGVIPELPNGLFNNRFEMGTRSGEGLMVLKDHDLCEHAEYFGGNEKRFHRSANGFTRAIMCKEPECGKAIIQAHRKDAVELWKFLVLIAVGTKYGRKARSRALFQYVGRLRFEAKVLEDKKEAGDATHHGGKPVATKTQGPMGYLAHSASSSFSGWSLVQEAAGSEEPAPMARIVRGNPSVPSRVWVYGVCIAPDMPLPAFPVLEFSDQDILEPPPADHDLVDGDSPFAGRTFDETASSAEGALWCTQVMAYAFGNNPMRPEIYRFGFYLYGRLRQVRVAALRMQGGGSEREGKRVQRPGDMITTRQIKVPVATDPSRLDVVAEHECDVMMTSNGVEEEKEAAPPATDLPEIFENFATSEADPPGLAVLDSGCTKTMHGEVWASRFEEELTRLGLAFEALDRPQVFRGVGGQAPGSLPLLLSRPFMETSRGHLAVNLLEFNKATLDDFKKSEDALHVLEPSGPGDHTPTPSEVDQANLAYNDVLQPGESPGERGTFEEDLDLWRQDVLGWERETGRGTDDRHGEVSEDVNYFEENVAQDPMHYKKATNRKFKKITSLSAAVDGDDFMFRVGLLLLFVLAGMAVASTLDTDEDYVMNAAGRRQLNHDMKVEDPYVTYIVLDPPVSHCPSGPIISPGKLIEAQIDKRPALAVKVIKGRMANKRHFILEVPGPWPEGEELEELNRMVEKGEVTRLVVPGLSHNTDNNRASTTTLVTSLVCLESLLESGDMLEAATVSGDVPGLNREPAGLYPLVLEAVTQQALVEITATKEAQDALPVETGGRKNLYLDRTVPSTARLLAPVGDTNASHLPVAADGDDQSHRAIMAGQLDPVLSMTEQVLRDLHVNFGHPTNVTLQRILRRKRPKPVRLPTKYEFNNHLMIDVFYSKDIRGMLYSFLNILCDATGFQVVCCLGEAQGPPASKVVLRHFLTSWSSWAGLPNSLQVDRGKEYLAHFSSFLKNFGVEQEAMPLEAPFKMGKAEKAGGLWKEIFDKVVIDMQLSGIDDVVLASTIVTQVRNSFPRTSGYAPNSWVLGKPEIRLPGSLLIDQEAERLEVLETAEDPHSAMARSLGIREAARVAQVRLDTDSRVRRALLRQSTPTRGPYPVGSYVYFFRAQVPPGAQRNFRWHGPARVIGVELRNSTRLQDPEVPTSGGQPHAYWLRYGTNVVLVTGEQLRFASEDELLAAHMVRQEVLAPPYARGARGFVDLRYILMLQPEVARVPGTELVVDAALLPPVPEGDPQGELEAIGETLPRVQGTGQNERCRLCPANQNHNLLYLLDGYAPVRPQSRPPRSDGPYFAEEDHWDPPFMTTSVRESRLRKMIGDESIYETDTEDEIEGTDLDVFITSADVFLTGRAVRSEVKLKDLTEKDREAFTQSMAKEWSSWMKFNAVEILTPTQISKLPTGTKIIGTRWVHTDKNQKQRLLALHLSKKTGKDKEAVMKEYPFSAKSRLVVQGHQEGWEILACDASTAYLQSQGISRLLVLRPPRPPPPGVSPGDLLRAKGSIYGTRDAGRSWWRKLHQTLKGHCWRMSRIEPAFFILAEGPTLLGVLITHVDDLYAAGEGEKFLGTIHSMEKELHLTIKRGEFRFCGKNVKQDDQKVSLNQMDAIEAIDFMLLPTDRRKSPSSPLTEAEKTAFRGLIGQFGWVVRQTRPDLMVNVSIAAQSMGCPTVKDVVELNKAVKLLKDSSEAPWNFVKHKDLTLDSAAVFCFADSSFANLEGSKSQSGYVVGFTTEDILRGGPAPIHIVEAYSGSIKRVCRSTLAAEANGFLGGAEATEFLRALLMEIKHPDVKMKDLDELYLKKKTLCFTDAKSLEQTLNKDTGAPQDKRVRILIAQIKEMIGENNYEDNSPSYAYWVDTSQMLADVLTKLGCDRDPLLRALCEGEWQLQPSSEARDRKLAIQIGRHARKEKARAKSAM
ncbi:RE2, partial [Symbiodinium necroappetens]